MYNSLETIITILKKPQEKRTRTDLEQLSLLIDSTSYFKEKHFDIMDLHYIAQELEYVNYQKGDCIIEYGNCNDTLYIILNGELSVLEKDEIEDEQNQETFKEINLLKPKNWFGQIFTTASKYKFVNIIIIELLPKRK